MANTNKRSKRHRINRNNISDKDRYNSTVEFGDYSRKIEKRYQASLAKRKSLNSW